MWLCDKNPQYIPLRKVKVPNTKRDSRESNVSPPVCPKLCLASSWSIHERTTKADKRSITPIPLTEYRTYLVENIKHIEQK